MASCGCDTVLTWIPGEFAATHDVYFGAAARVGFVDPVEYRSGSARSGPL